MGIAVGIDLGTSNSALAKKGLAMELVKNSEGEVLTPSVVALLTSDLGGTLVGRPAVAISRQFPESTVRSIKRLMGADFEEPAVQRMIRDKKTSYFLSTDPKELGSVRVSIQDKLFSPEELSSLILGKIKADAEKDLNQAVTQAVVTVPAYFSDRQKFATRKACELAGIDLLRLLPEPTAAALSFGLGELAEHENKTVMIFDLGGGTFDVSILNIAGGHFLEVAKGGDMWLGGDDIDDMLMKHVLTKSEAASPEEGVASKLGLLEPHLALRFQAALRAECEKAKIKLSTHETVWVEICSPKGASSKCIFDTEVEVTRQELEDLLEPTNQRLEKLAREIVAGVHFDLAMIDLVVMVGGSSLIPCIQDRMRSVFGVEKVKIHPRPEAAVAEGAAHLAHSLTAKNADGVRGLLHTSAHSYYLQLAGGAKIPLVEKGTPLPHQKTEHLQFVSNQQQMARLRVLNELDGFLENIGEMWLYRDGDHPILDQENQTTVSFDLEFKVDEDNIIELRTSLSSSRGKTSETGLEKSSQLSRSGLGIRLRNELELLLEKSFRDKSEATRNSTVQLSKKIIQSILLAETTPDSVESRRLTLKAQAQLETLKSLDLEENCPIFCNLISSEFLKALPAAELETNASAAVYRAKYADFCELYDSFSDSVSLERAMKELEKIESEFAPPVVGNAVAFICASRGGNKKDVEKLRSEIAGYFFARQGHDQEGMQQKVRKIELILEGYDATHSSVSQQFHRDVQLRSN